MSTNTYETLENAYDKLQEFFDNNDFGPEHSEMILKHEELGKLLDSLDIELIEERSGNLNILHEEFKNIKKDADDVIREMNDSIDHISSAAKVISKLDRILSGIKSIII